MRRRFVEWRDATAESAMLALDSVRVHPARSILATAGIVVGIVTVVLVASTLANLRNQVTLLFRELGTDNVFVYHRSGDPYQPPSEREAQRRPLEPDLAEALARQGGEIREVAVQIIVPPVINGRALVARAGGAESDSVLVEGASASFFGVVGAQFAAGRPFTALEDRAGAPVAVVGANLARALFAGRSAVGRSIRLGGDSYLVVGELAPRPGGLFGVNRQDNVMSLAVGRVKRRFPQAEDTVLYVRGAPGRREAVFGETELALRRLRRIAPDQPNDFNLSTSDRIIGNFDRLSVSIGLATLALAAVSLVIGGIGVANVMIISVRERTREIGVRRAIGARKGEVTRQFLIEAVLLSGTGGLAGVAVATLIGLLITVAMPGFSAAPPVWAIVAGVGASVGTGVVAGYLPARRAASLDPVEALRHE